MAEGRLVEGRSENFVIAEMRWKVAWGLGWNESAFRIQSVKSDTSVCGSGRLFMVPAAGYT